MIYDNGNNNFGGQGQSMQNAQRPMLGNVAPAPTPAPQNPNAMGNDSGFGGNQPQIRPSYQNDGVPAPSGNLSGNPQTQTASLFHAPEATPRNLPTQPGWGIQPGVTGGQIMNMNGPKYQPQMQQGAMQPQNGGGPQDLRQRGPWGDPRGFAPIDPERRGGAEGLPPMQDPWSGKFGSLGGNAWGAGGYPQRIGAMPSDPTAPINPERYGSPEGLPPIHDPVGGGLGKPTIFGPPAAQPGQTNPWLQHYLAQTRSF